MNINNYDNLTVLSNSPSRYESSSILLVEEFSPSSIVSMKNWGIPRKLPKVPINCATQIKSGCAEILLYSPGGSSFSDASSMDLLSFVGSVISFLIFVSISLSAVSSMTSFLLLVPFVSKTLSEVTSSLISSDQIMIWDIRRIYFKIGLNKAQKISKFELKQLVFETVSFILTFTELRLGSCLHNIRSYQSKSCDALSSWTIKEYNIS